jgi:hypothetical protein
MVVVYTNNSTTTLLANHNSRTRGGRNLQTQNTYLERCLACTYWSIRVVSKRITDREIGTSLEAPSVTSLRTRTTSGHNQGGFAGPFHGPQNLQFRIYLFQRSETSVQMNHRLLQHQCTLKEKFEECELALTSSEIMEIEPPDV